MSASFVDQSSQHNNHRHAGSITRAKSCKQRQQRVAEAQRLRADGLTYREIGERLGVHLSTAYDYVTGKRTEQVKAWKKANPEKVRAANLARNDKKREWDRENYYKLCPDCGEKEIRRSTERCIACLDAFRARKRHNRIKQLSSLWAEGLPVKRIAQLLDSTPGSVGVEIARAKKKGWSFPPRRKGWNGHTKKVGAKNVRAETPEQARQRLAYAIQTGRVKRPDRCERCGDVARIEGHHEEYSKPLKVEWLCRTCHSGLHLEERRAAA